MKIQFRLSKPASGLRVTSSTKDAEIICRFLNIPAERLDLAFVNHRQTEGRDIVTFQFRDHYTNAPVPRFRSVFRGYHQKGESNCRAQYGRDGVDPAPDLANFGTLVMVVTLESNGEITFILPPKEKRPMPQTSHSRPRVKKEPAAPVPIPVTEGTALVLMSFAGKEMSFNLPLGEAFEMAVNLTAKGYGK